MGFRICNNLEEFFKKYFLEKIENKGFIISKEFEDLILYVIEELKKKDIYNIGIYCLKKENINDTNTIILDNDDGEVLLHDSYSFETKEEILDNILTYIN